MFKIRDLIIDPPLILAPIAGHTDSLFRKAIKELGGCGLVVSELVSTEGMTRHQKRTCHLTRYDEMERPISIQIFGSDSERMAESAAMVQEMGVDIVDINMGCPVKKVVRQGGGSNLLRDMPLMEKIFKAVRKAIQIPLTVKIRSGWDKNSINAIEVLKLAEDCGIEALTIHGRTRADMFTGHADWKVIARIKESARIPIIGNGDVFSPEDAKRMFEETSVDGVMIGRGVLSNPWLIRQCWDHINGLPVMEISYAERAAFVLRFLNSASKEAPPQVALGKIKKLGGCLSKGFPLSSQLRAKMHAAHSIEDFFGAVEKHFKETI
jgi:nifR3 family TIM-barrel protein